MMLHEGAPLAEWEAELLIGATLEDSNIDIDVRKPLFIEQVFEKEP